MVSAAKRQKLMAEIDPGRNPDHLANFLNELRNQGYQVGPNEYATCQDLVLALIARGTDISDANTFKLYLAPILCSNPREQDLFGAHYDRWWRRESSSQAKSQKGEEPNRFLTKAGLGWRTWRWILGGSALFVAALLVFPWQFAITSFHVAWIAIAWFATAFILAVSAGTLWWYFSGRLFLDRKLTDEEPNLASVAVDPHLAEVLDRRLLGLAAREMRRRYAVEADALDVQASLDATCRRLGEFTPVRSKRYVSPEYLVLIDRRHLQDENAQYIDEMIVRLKQDQVFIERFYFERDPRMLHPPDRNGQPISLRNMAAYRSEYRVLLFSDAAALFDQLTGELARWSEPLWRFSKLAIFTPKPMETWAYREQVLSQRAFVFPAAPDSILQFGRRINRIPAKRLEIETVSSPYPSDLALRPGYWLSRVVPSFEEVETMLSSLRRFLGTAGFFWFSACGVYPGVTFNLTLYLGSNLTNEAHETLFSGERLSNLLRLPWLQYGYMPDWLRLELVRRLSKFQEKQVREALDRLWLSVSTGSDRPIKLEIARRYPFAMRILARRVFRAVSSKGDNNSPLQDYVFASFMLGRNVEPLAVRVPRLWRKLMRPVGQRNVMQHVVPSVELQPASMTRRQEVVKRTFDVVFSLVVLVLLAPLFLAIAASIKLTSKGPILYRSTRVGMGGRYFAFLKFRSMLINNPRSEAVGAGEMRGHIFKVKYDPRVTVVGRVLRRYSLDELPQFVNVLRGEMSIVGPRPLPASDLGPDGMSEHFYLWSRGRSRVRPGITGLWQVSGRSDLAFEDMVRLDLAYVQNWSLALDVRIIIYTPMILIRGSGAN
jgi:lipopolysaccharide/colanic/teichoic acid biosynthesis glycosyltransferase